MFLPKFSSHGGIYDSQQLKSRIQILQQTQLVKLTLHGLYIKQYFAQNIHFSHETEYDVLNYMFCLPFCPLKP